MKRPLDRRTREHTRATGVLRSDRSENVHPGWMGLVMTGSYETMSDDGRENRLRRELEGLRALKRKSSIFDFEGTGEPPEKFTVSFRGKGLVSTDDKSGDPQVGDLHQIRIEMAYLYPEREPDIRWLTPIFHPNISNSGFVGLEDIGLEWSSELTLDIICERLWDVIRLAYHNLDGSGNVEAKEWFRNRLTLKLPIDARPIRDRAVATQSNVVQYSRRNGKKPVQESAAGGSGREILFIGEEKAAEKPVEIPSPPLRGHPPHGAPLPQPGDVPSSSGLPKPGSDDDDILFLD